MKSTCFFVPGQVSSYESDGIVDDEENGDYPKRQCERVLLCGSDWSVGTTLVLQLACRMALDREGDGGGGGVWIVTTREMMEMHRPLVDGWLMGLDSSSGWKRTDNLNNSIHLAERMKNAWSKIYIKYVETLYDVVKLGAVLHMAENGPTVVVLHGLEKMMDGSNKIMPSLLSSFASSGRGGGQRVVSVESLLCRGLGVMCNAMETVANNNCDGFEKNKGDIGMQSENIQKCKGKKCMLLGTMFSSNLGEPPRNYYLVKRWFEDMFGFYRIHGSMDGYMLSRVGGLHGSQGPTMVGTGVAFQAARDGIKVTGVSRSS